MSIAVKICGLNDADAMQAAIEGGAAYVGLVFYPPSPRFVALPQAAQLGDKVPEAVRKVGLFVDPTNDLLTRTLAEVPLDIIQLHGKETPNRVSQIKAITGLPVMKAVGVATAADLKAVAAYDSLADYLLFDAAAGALPGGNGKPFDWGLLKDIRLRHPWMLGGGLNAGNLAAAVAVTGAKIVDVSSGVESAPGRKDPAKIRAFLRAAKDI